jgi:ATP-dependent RNA helicase DDX55/SPB4
MNRQIKRRKKRENKENDWKDWANEERLAKKLRRGKITKEEFDELVYGNE